MCRVHLEGISFFLVLSLFFAFVLVADVITDRRRSAAVVAAFARDTAAIAIACFGFAVGQCTVNGGGGCGGRRTPDGQRGRQVDREEEPHDRLNTARLPERLQALWLCTTESHMWHTR